MRCSFFLQKAERGKRELLLLLFLPLSCIAALAFGSWTPFAIFQFVAFDTFLGRRRERTAFLNASAHSESGSTLEAFRLIKFARATFSGSHDSFFFYKEAARPPHTGSMHS